VYVGANCSRCFGLSSFQASQERHGWQHQGTETHLSYVWHFIANIVQKIRERQLAAPALSETLQELCLNELKEKKHTATEGLLWLTRYLPLPSHLLQTTNTYLVASTSPPKPSATTSPIPIRSSPTPSAMPTATPSSLTTPSS
jgi:hypothetical protein